MKKAALVLLCAVLSATGVNAELSRVSVKGNHFVTADGKTVIFRGLDTSDPDKLERNDQWNPHYFEEAKAWGANVVRFPVHPAAWHIRGKKNYLKLLDEGVKWAGEQGMYVIIDWHSIGNLYAEKFFPARPSFIRPTYTTPPKPRLLISGRRWRNITAVTAPLPFSSCSTSRRSTPS